MMVLVSDSGGRCPTFWSWIVVVTSSTIGLLFVFSLRLSILVCTDNSLVIFDSQGFDVSFLGPLAYVGFWLWVATSFRVVLTSEASLELYFAPFEVGSCSVHCGESLASLVLVFFFRNSYGGGCVPY